MEGWNLPAERISPQEAVLLFRFARTDLFSRVQSLVTAYRARFGSCHKDPDWDAYKLLCYIYATGCIQGMREERARYKQS